MTASVLAPQCLVCETGFTPQADWVKGEIIQCGACGQEHEVIEFSDTAVRVELAPEVEEDWGE